jgi:hypothetical protein
LRVAGALALKPGYVEAICGLRCERRDRSVARNRGLVEPFELDGWPVAEGFVQARRVEPANVFDDRELELGAVRQTRSAISSVTDPC